MYTHKIPLGIPFENRTVRVVPKNVFLAEKCFFYHMANWESRFFEGHLGS